MKLSHLSGRALLCALACVSAFGASGDIGNGPLQEALKPNSDKQDRSWRRYRNPDLGYCVNYPSRWFRGSAFEGSGLFVETGRNHSKPGGEIDIGPMGVDMPEDARLKPASLTEETLADDLQEHLADLRKFARAERVEIIDQHKLDMQGTKALYAKNRYYDPLERTLWMEEVVFVRHKGELYRLEMQCPPDQIGRFEVVFAHLVNTLQFDCR